ncbi:diphthamide synthesis dph1/dph2 [Babesia gibsoni]|uniref:Diphthamide synthesis dph1/dph2 n=1 Tax=Babesia gibsoni TaxID=33632 RepID=A0AAD8LPL8_BABGI|nr:diphthamide synthesis dph1/dph2 [Babesia gibsoni]
MWLEDVDAIASEIRDKGYRRIAIQSSDVTAATTLCTELSRRFHESEGKEEFYVLGDVFIGSCCTDLIAAKRCDADYVLHVGPSCQSSIAPQMPVRRVFNRVTLDESILRERVNQVLGAHEFERVLIIYDTAVHHLRYVLCDILRHLHKETFIAECREYVSVNTECTGEQETFCGRTVLSITEKGEEAVTVDSLCLGDKNTLVVYIKTDTACEGSLDQIAISSAGSQFHVIHISNGNASESNEDSLGDKLRLRRYRNVEKVKAADTIGVMVVSRNLRHSSELRLNLAKLIKHSGKRSYALSVNCLTEAKLANFPNIDVYCLMSCGSAAMSLPDEISRRTVSPYDLLVGLDRMDWSMPYEFDFSRLLRYTHIEGVEKQDARKQEMRKLQGGTELKVQVEAFMATLPDNSKRTFSGVDPEYGISDKPTIIKGFHGTASGYEHERLL